MKKIPSSLKRLTLIAFAIALFAFSVPGGNNYSISLNNKQIVQEFLTRQRATPQISLAQVAETDEYQVYFSHCGQIGKSRSLSILNEQNKVLKAWRYDDTNNEHTPMKIKAQDIQNLPHDGIQALKLVYASREITEGIVLVNFVFSKETARK